MFGVQKTVLTACEPLALLGRSKHDREACLQRIDDAALRQWELPQEVGGWAVVRKDHDSPHAPIVGVDVATAAGAAVGCLHTGIEAPVGAALPCAARPTPCRRRLGGDAVSVCTYVTDDCAHPVRYCTVAEHARRAAELGADCLLLRASYTGVSPDPAELHPDFEMGGLPVLATSGVMPAPAASILEMADSAIVGRASRIEVSGCNEVDPASVPDLIGTAVGARRGVEWPCDMAGVAR
jgi:predicted TIM-barrel enzyme